MRWLLAVVAIAGCDLPPFQLAYRYSGGPAQSCAPPTQPAGMPVTCDRIPLACDAILSVRAVTASEPNAPHIPVCAPVPKNNGGDVCAIATIDLPAAELPKETLEVQVAVWPLGAVQNASGDLDCRPYALDFDRTDGFPVPPPPKMSPPGLGGRAFFHPGDDRVVVTLGCADLEAANALCGATAVKVQTTVEDFDTGASVVPDDATLLGVTVGTPRQVGERFVLLPSDVRRLDLSSGTSTPVWSKDVDLALKSTACIGVLDDDAESTTAVRCRATPSDTSQGVSATGMRLAKETLKKILLGAEFPEEGLTVGIVLDQGVPKAGFSVELSDPSKTVEYLVTSGTGFGGTQTSDRGIFVSRDAPYGTGFQATDGSANTLEAIGGLIVGKVTVVVLEVTQGNL